MVVAHRGASSNWPENTLPAFAAATKIGVVMQEFDVRSTRDDVLVCVHDATLDRTTDAALRLGPGAAVAQARREEVAGLDAGRWFGPEHAGTRIPTLGQALDVMLPNCIPMIEHKAGSVRLYLDELRQHDALHRCVLQSFDWKFVAEARASAPDLATALLGPSHDFPRLDRAVLAAAEHIGAGMLHWNDRQVHLVEIEQVHVRGLLLCTYTTDDEVGWFGGAALGIDAMCTNAPERMIELRGTGALRRSGPAAQ
ncbi:MAG: glycerophosphodiester phosphodiesterase family protein [Planctomycetota bacterium]